MNWQSHRTHQLSFPAREGLAELAKEIAPGSRAIRIRRMGGGLATATHSVDLEGRTGKSLPVVLKRYRENDETAALEWDRLTSLVICRCHHLNLWRAMCQAGGSVLQHW